MLSADRGGFAKLMETLCAGYNVPATEARLDAYWRGCASLHLLAFERTVDFALGPDSDADELPTPRELHRLHRQMLSARRAAAAAPDKPAVERDVFEVYCNRLLLLYLWGKARRLGSAATDASLQAMTECKNRYVAAYRDMCLTEPTASLELRDALIDSLEPLFSPRTEGAERPVQHVEDTWQPLGLVGLV